VITDETGRRSYHVSWQCDRPVPATVTAVYTLPQGIAVAPRPFGGIGVPFPKPPMRNCFPVFIASDSEGMFGHQCPACGGYWRARGPACLCAYCGTCFASHQLLSPAQQAYVGYYCKRLCDALEADQDGEHIIEMDSVADVVGRDIEKPAFYFAEQSQQHNFVCEACDSTNDILGTFGYCSICGTRNDLTELETNTIPRLRARINAGGPYNACVKDAVVAFDLFVRQYLRQLLRHVPMTPGRKARMEKMYCHNLETAHQQIHSVFDINILQGLDSADIEFAKLMFHRRHVYEHNGGEADEKYILDSGDTSVRPKQKIHETQSGAHRLAGVVSKMATNVHRGFHSIFPPEQGPITLKAK
jgi:hypothetical protein